MKTLNSPLHRNFFYLCCLNWLNWSNMELWFISRKMTPPKIWTPVTYSIKHDWCSFSQYFISILIILTVPYYLYLYSMTESNNWFIQKKGNESNLNIKDWLPLLGVQYFGQYYTPFSSVCFNYLQTIIVYKFINDVYVVID